jgi:hypothetical protein
VTGKNANPQGAEKEMDYILDQRWKSLLRITRAHLVILLLLGCWITFTYFDLKAELGRPEQRRYELLGRDAQQRAKQQRAEVEMVNLSTSLQMYYFNHRKYPTNLDALTEVDPKTGEAYMDEIPKDPWGNPYDLKLLSGNKLKLTSFGKDGQEGTEDDIVWPPTAQD